MIFRSIRGIDWRVVGHFDEGDALQCVVYTDVDVLMSSFNRSTYNQVSVMLQSPADFEAFRDALQANPALRLEAQHESESVEEDFKQLKGLLDFASYFVGAIMAIGATLGAVNSLYAIVDARRRELSTLRAIGFGPSAVVASILCESLFVFTARCPARSRCGVVIFRWTLGEPFRLQFSTGGNAATRSGRRRLGAGNGLGGRPATRVAGSAIAGCHSPARHLSVSGAST